MNHLKLLFFCLFSGFAFSQDNKQIAFRELTVEQGLSQNSVVSIAQDSIGFMWFATQDGLNKYDGKQFIHYPYQFEDVTRSTYSKLGKVYVDNFDHVWIVANSGVVHKKNKTSKSFDLVDQINNASTLFQASNNDYFIGTYGSGLYHISQHPHDTTQILKPNDKHLVSFDMFQLYNNVLVATKNGILKINGDGNYQFIQIQEDTNFSSFARMSQNKTLFLGSYGKGLFMANEEIMNFKPFLGFDNAKLPNNLIIQDILVDSRGKLWVATYGDGAYLIDFETKTIQHLTANKVNPYALHYNDVLNIYEDFTGIVWLGTDGSGLSYYDKDLMKFNVLTNKQAPDNVSIDFVRAIVKRDNDVWLGTSNKGLTTINFETDTYTMYTMQNSTLASDRVMSLHNNEDGLWIGHQNKGLQKFESNKEFKNFKSTNGMSIWKIYQAENHRLWLCTLNGLVLFDELQGVIKTYNSENSALISNAIRTVEVGDKNQLWIGTESDGLYLLNTKTETITKLNAVQDRIKSLYFNDGILWIGTNGNGLKSYKTKSKITKYFTTAQGLTNNVIYGILPDSKNNLWLSSNKGLMRLKISKEEVVEIENFSNYDGLQTDEFNTGAYFKDDKGMLYFGGLEGLNWFNPNQLSYNTDKPKTVITNFEIFAKPYPILQNNVFSAEQNTMTFTFSGLHYSQPSRNQYKYQLVNHDTDWISAGNNNSAHYTNLAPDDYTFKVISSNYDGVWNDEPAIYKFTIKNPWYLSSLAWFCYVLLAIALGVWVYRYLKWRWYIKMQLEFEHQETERLKKLDMFKTKLYTNISHEFRTPLTLISGPIDNQLTKPNINVKDKKELSLVKQNADRLLKLVDQMLNLSMIDSGQIKLKVSKGNLSIVLKQIICAFQYKANKKNILIKSTIHDLKDVWFDKDIIEKVTSNLLSNAIKYAPKNTTVVFETVKQENMLVLSVINSSKHVGKKDLSKLFQRFYQDNELSDGVGVGLALVRDLVTLSKGTIIANNIDDNKIQFTVSLPINDAAFNTEDIVIETNRTKNILKAKSIDNPKTDKLSLLIVEDDKDIRAFITSIFINDYQIIEANNGKCGIEKAQKNLPNLIISDIMMPVKDGIELCHDIKTNELTSHIPVILLTAKVGDKNEIEGLKTGADAYITKPFSSEKLKIRVEKLIESRRQLQKYFSKTLSINPELAITSTETEFLKKLQSVLDEHITDPEFTSEQFGKLMLMSRTQLHRKLKAISNMSTSEFIRSQRLKLSKELLDKSDATISEIAYQVGFNSPSYFIKCFKELYHCTPNEHQSKAL